MVGDPGSIPGEPKVLKQRNDLMNKMLEVGRPRKLEMAFRPGIGAGKPADWAKWIRRNVVRAALPPWI